MLNRSTTLAVALLVVTFAAGVVVGVGSRAVWARYAEAAAPERRRGPDRLTTELNDALRLTPVQRDTVRAIIQRHWARMSEVFETVRPRFDSMRAQMDSEVLRQLTPSQQVKYRDHMARHRHQKEKADSGGKRP
jgi:hypothetical protein